MTIVGILVGIIILSIIMVVHELGHFLAGRLLGFKIEQFSLFMGPVLFEREKNGIRYNIKAIPIGASVSFAGEYTEIEGKDEPAYDPDDPGLFYNRPRWRRAVVVFMGPFINIVTAFLAFLILFASFGAVVPRMSRIEPGTLVAESGEIAVGDEIVRLNGHRVETGLDLSMASMLEGEPDRWTVRVRKPSGETHDVIMDAKEGPPQVMIGMTYLQEGDRYVVQSVLPESNNGRPVLREGDVLLSVNGVPFDQSEKVSAIIAASEGTPLAIEVLRHDVPQTVETVPLAIRQPMPLGITLTGSRAFSDALTQALRYPKSIIRSTFNGLSLIFNGRLRAKDGLAGPIGIVSMVSSTVKQSRSVGEAIEYVLMLFGLISVAVGFTNLLPIPPFDGSHLVFTGIEAVRRKPLSQRFREITGMIGFAVFILFFILVIYLDMSRLFGF